MHSVRQAAPLLGLSVASVYDLCSARRIRHQRVGPNGGKIRISQAAIDDYLRGCEVAVSQSPGVAAPPGKPKVTRRGGPRLCSDGKPFEFIID
jgi:excisionase family DNA binding protein